MNTIEHKRTTIINTLLDRQCPKCNHAGSNTGTLCYLSKEDGEVQSTKQMCRQCMADHFNGHKSVQAESFQHKVKIKEWSAFRGQWLYYQWTAFKD